MVCLILEGRMKKLIKASFIAATMVSGMAFAQSAETNIEGIFNALNSSANLQVTVDKLLADGANPKDLVAVAAASGISLDTVKDLQVCVNGSSNDAKTLSASCMRQKTIVTAYNEGVNDPIKYLPATAAGKKALANKEKN